jgi:DHA2 family multidrug resistance protein
MIAGFGVGCIFVPLTTLAVGTLRNEQIGNASSLQNLIRNTGGSIGLSFVATLLQRYSQIHQSMMAAQMSPLNPQYEQKSAALQKVFEQRFSAPDALARAQGFLYHTLLQQSDYWAFVNVFLVVACFCAVSVLCVLTYEKPRKIHAVALSD